MATYVFIWEENMFSNKKKNIQHEWPGHPVINIGDTFDRPAPDTSKFKSEAYAEYARDKWQDNLQNNYVSGGRGEIEHQLQHLRCVPGRFREGKYRLCICEDVQVEGYVPDHVIKLDSDAAAEKAMMGEWIGMLNKHKNRLVSYQPVRKNCSTIASRVLHAGGFYFRKWAENNNWVWTPSAIKQLALAAGGTRIKWQDFTTPSSKNRA